MSGRHLETDARVSIIVPCLNEEENVRPLYERTTAVLRAAGVDFEIIFSLDPCADGTEDVIRAIRARDPLVKMIRLSRRFGQAAATIAGLSKASGDACVVIDCDLQDPPEVIGEMIERWHEGFDVVYAQRRTRQGETLVKRVVAALGYRLIRRTAEVDIPANTGDFRLMSRRVVDEVLRLRESHGFLRGLVALVGFSQTSVLYDRASRHGGRGHYNRFLGSLRIGLNGVVGFSRYPLHLISILGLLLSLTAILLGLAYLILTLVNIDIPWGNPTLVMLVCLFGGIQLLSLGIMGEYVGRIYDEVKQRPLFIVESMEGFERPESARAFECEPLEDQDATRPSRTSI